MLRIEMVAVGDELLTGAVVNSNAARLAEALAAAGLGLRAVLDVGDEVDEIAATVSACCARADVVVVSGGLGATSDDLTREGLAQAAGVDLHRDPAVEERLREVYRDYGLPIPDLAYRQADVPAGAELLANPVGSAPGLRMRLGRAVVYALPGVPSELEAMLSGQVVAELAALAGDHAMPVTATVRVAVAGESAVAAALGDLERDPRVAFAYLAGFGDVRVKMTGTDAAAVAAVAEQAASLLGAAVYSTDGRSLPAVVHALLRERAATVAVAESLTGGMVAAALTDTAGASATFLGGAIVYATEMKARHAGVPADLLAELGPVDPDVALALAEGVRRAFDTTYAVATTGVAGPDPVGSYPVGAVYVAVAGPDGPRVVRRDIRGDRDRVRRLTVVHALDLLRRALLGLPPHGD